MEGPTKIKTITRNCTQYCIYIYIYNTLLLGVFTFYTCCKIVIYLLCFFASFNLSFVSLLLVGRVYCCSYLVCVIILCVFVVLYVYCCFYFRFRTACQKSVFGMSCDRPPRHRFFLVSLCLKANAEMVPNIPSCHYMLLMQPS